MHNADTSLDSTPPTPPAAAPSNSEAKVSPPLPPDLLSSLKRKAGRMGLKLASGYEWNPLLKLPPNSPCPCQSKAKFKRCCRRKLPVAVTAEVAERYRKQLKLGNVVFVTKENEEAMTKSAMATAEADCEGCARGDVAKLDSDGKFRHGPADVKFGSRVVQTEPFVCLRAPHA